MRPVTLVCASVLSTGPFAPLTAQQLVADLATGPSFPALSSDPEGFVALPAVACFRAGTAEGGPEPWRTDGTSAGTLRLRDLVPGAGTSNPRMHCEYQGQVLFTAELTHNGERLFLTDGTPQGTVLLPDLGIGSPVRAVHRLANGRVLIDAYFAVYESDLTVAGTQPIPGMQFFTPGTDQSGVTYGSCEVGGQFEVWATDGTAAGSSVAVSAFPGYAAPANFVAWNGRIYYHEFATGAVWLSSTDGVTGSIRHVQLANWVAPQSVGRMFVRNGELVFVLDGQLIRSDLTPSGTGPVALPCTDLADLVESGGALFFRATTPAAGYELWTTDGTAAGTSLVADLRPGPASSFPDNFVEAGSGVFFRALDFAGVPHLLHVSAPNQGVDLGTLPAGAPSGQPTSPTPGAPLTGFTPFGNGVLFAADDPVIGREPWFGSLTQAPALLDDIHSNGRSLNLGPQPVAVPVRERLLFGSSGSGGVGLYVTDGVTTRLAVPWAGSTSGSKAVRFGDRIVYLNTSSVFAADPDGANPVVLYTGAYPSNVQVSDDRIYFLGALGRLHTSDGTVAGTGPVAAAANVLGFTYFLLPDRIVLMDTSVRLWGTDGVSPAQQLTQLRSPVVGIVGDRLVFLEGQLPPVLSATDGTVAGTTPLLALPAGYYLGAAGGSRAYVTQSTTIWETDGTPGGTAVAVTLPAGMTLPVLAPTAEELLITAVTAATGRELWRLDRSTGQLVLVADIAPGGISGVGRGFPVGDGDLLFLSAGDEVDGFEPWVSDGTAAGTRQLADVNPGANSSNPILLGVADDTVYFTADDGVHGTEVWSIPLPLVGAAYVQRFGLGCPGAAGRATTTPTGAPQPGASGFGFLLDAVQPSTLVALGLGETHASVALGPCELLLGGTVLTVLGVADLSGRAAFAVPLPTGPGLIGYRFVAQGFGLDATTPQGFVAADGQIVVIGL